MSLTLSPLPDHFDPDPHLALAGAEVESVRVLAGEAEQDDTTVVTYRGNPCLSFYNTHGRLIDVDHYLPDAYRRKDAASVDVVLNNLPIKDRDVLERADRFAEQLGAVVDAGGGSLARGLDEAYGLKSELGVEEVFRQQYELNSDDSLLLLLDTFKNMDGLLRTYIRLQLATTNEYVHFTDGGGIVITPLDRRSGVAVMIETRDGAGTRLPPPGWRITRTNSATQLEKALTFRSADIREFFDPTILQSLNKTDRYVLYRKPNRLEFDSLLDDTANLLTVPLYNGCYQILSTDAEVIAILSGPRQLSIVNTHGSIVPQKWLQLLALPEEVSWVRVDENLTFAFCTKPNGELIILDIGGEEVTAHEQYEGLQAAHQRWQTGFSIDQTGALTLIGIERDGGKQKKSRLTRVRTNVNEVRMPGREKSLDAVFADLSDLFRGEALFEPTTFARRIVPEAPPAPEELLPSAIESARFDFETNVDHLLATAGTDYGALLKAREKLAIARENIAERFTTEAAESGIRLVGRRLRQTINSVVRPAERRVTALIEHTRAGQLLDEAKAFKEGMHELNEPGAYRDVLNAIRSGGQELRRMDPANAGRQYGEYKAIQTELNDLFSRQIAEDGNALQAFITKEIEQLEEAIAAAHEPRPLESILTTHPAALELLDLLKQPFVLQSIAREQALSPAGIQHRLYEAIQKRLEELRAYEEKQEAERNAAKLQFGGMIREAIDFFVSHYTGGYGELELRQHSGYAGIRSDIAKLERTYGDTRLAGELRAYLERVMLRRNREGLERAVAHEGRYAFVKNDPELYVDLESTVRKFPVWALEMIEKAGATDRYLATFIRNTDREVYRPSTTDNLLSGRAFETDGHDVADYLEHYYKYVAPEHGLQLLEAVWEISRDGAEVADYPQYAPATIEALLPKEETARRALGAAREKKRRDQLERTRDRGVPTIDPEFIDETPYFQQKLREFFIKAKLQLGTGSGVLLLSGPPSTGKSAFLKFASALMNREYFEHASDKWQTKNSLVTAVRFGEAGPYTTPAGFTRAITTAHSLVNIEEIKEWPEALRKSLNPFFAGSKLFIAPDGTQYRIGDNLLLCAAANLGAMYRLEDEAFTADFWSRIDVVEYDYAPQRIERKYMDQLHQPRRSELLTMQDVVREAFAAPESVMTPDGRARDLSRQLLEFLLLPKADDAVKRERLGEEISRYFEAARPGEVVYGPEEAAKVALRRVKDLQSLTSLQFFDLYDHFINGYPIRDPDIAAWQSTELTRYAHLNVVFRTLFYLEGCLRHLRELFKRTGGQSEIEGTNREFISAVYLMSLIGPLND